MLVAAPTGCLWNYECHDSQNMHYVHLYYEHLEYNSFVCVEWQTLPSHAFVAIVFYWKHSRPWQSEVLHLLLANHYYFVNTYKWHSEDEECSVEVLPFADVLHQTFCYLF